VTGPPVRAVGLARAFGGTLVLAGVDLAVDAGDVVAVLGPNGAGKTSLLRALAGLLPLARGRVSIDGVPVDDPQAGVFVAPERRSVGVVFQQYLLFPHLTVLENVAFGLRCRHVPRADARRRAREWLERVGVGDRADVKPDQLSGGQQQRVALARALVTEPRLVLLDEPLAALDVGTRTALRRDLRARLASYDGARVIVTHEMLDAVALADRLIVLERGRVAQHGTVAEVAQRPRSRYVADLVGVNLLRGYASGHTVGLESGATIVTADEQRGDVYVSIDPRAVSLHRTEPEGSPRNVWPGRISGTDLLGDRMRIHVDGLVPLVAEVTPAAVAAVGLHDGADVWAAVKATELSIYPA
jgi:molybdate transport system ATP-binding protein